MPLSIPNTTLPDAYSQAATFAGNDVFSWGFFTVANNAAFVQLFEGIRGQSIPQPEVYCPPATYPIAGGRRPISGIRARNAVAGSPAQFFGSIFYPDEPGIQAGTPFTSFISPTGGVVLGQELAYNEVTANVTVAGTTEATATALITASSITFVGSTPILIEYYCPRWQKLIAGASLSTAYLYQDGATMGLLGLHLNSGGAGAGMPAYFARRLTPTPGAHVYSIRASCTAANDFQFTAGAGGAGSFLPAFIRITAVA